MIVKQNGIVIFEGTRTKKFLDSLDNTNIFVSYPSPRAYGHMIELTKRRFFELTINDMRRGEFSQAITERLNDGNVYEFFAH